MYGLIRLHIRQATLARFFPILLAPCLFGCGGSGSTNTTPPPNVATVNVTPSSATITAGQKQQFSATAKDANGNTIAGVTFVWSSDTPSLATVDTTGLATGVNQGTAHITATASGLTGSATLTVNSPPTVATVTVMPSSATITAGQVQQFSATAKDANGNVIGGVTFTWNSDAPAIATVDTNALATGVSQGTAHITATTAGVTGSATLTVNAAHLATLFGLHIHSTSPWPTIGFGSFRLWDTATRWAQINTASGTYDFTKIDAFLAELKSHGIMDVVYTFGGVPQWASSNPADTSCDYASFAPAGGCDLPTDINADGSGSDQTWINFVTTLALHINNPTYLQTHAHIKFWEPWNEWYRNPVVNSYPWTSISLRSTYAQIVRMSEDLRCIITGTGSVNGTACSATAIDPTAKILTPSTGGNNCCGKQTVMQNFLYCNNSPIAGSQCTTGSRGSAAVDIINSHFYEAAGAQPETVANDVNQYTTFLSAADLAKPLWSDEGSWGNDSAVPDPDVQASWVARYYLVSWSSGLAEVYWYAYDSTTYGTLSKSASGLNNAGVAYGQVYNWIVGSALATPCSASGTVWTCGLTLANGNAAETIWDTSQTCSNGICTTSNQSVSSTWVDYQDLTGANHPIMDGTVPVGIKPILLESSSAP